MAFLVGEMDGRKIVVTPAFSPLAQGTEINIAPEEELLSPVLKERVDIDRMRVVGIDEDTVMLEFGELGKLRRI